MISRFSKYSLVVFSVVLCGSVAVAGPVLYVSDSSSQELYTLDPADASTTLVGSFGVGGFLAGMTFDSANEIMYGITTGIIGGTTTEINQLHSIDLVTGAATLIGELEATLVHGLAFDSVSGSLYGVTAPSLTDDSRLFEIDPVTGKATEIGPVGAENVVGLAFHPTSGVLYGAAGSGTPGGVGQLITIDPATGAGTLVALTTNLQGLSFNPETLELYGVHNGYGLRPDSLYRIDTVTGSATFIGETGLGNNFGLAFTPEPATLALLAIGFMAVVRRSGRRSVGVR